MKNTMPRSRNEAETDMGNQKNCQARRNRYRNSE
jgi:hypothetical protein